MSVTVSAVPIMFISAKLLATITTIAAASSTAAIAGCNLKTAIQNSEIDEILNSNSDINLSKEKIKLTKDDIELLSQEYETPFMNNDVLIQTLDEHGIKIIENNDNVVLAQIERLTLTFARQDEKSPYKIRMEFPKDCDEMQAEIIANLYEEYGNNTQEEVYIKIKEKIDKSSMYIEEEEVLDDNSIVLTININ